MSRPKRTTTDEICDRFADMDVDQQDGLLITLQQIHRQAKRRVGKSNGGDRASNQIDFLEDELTAQREP